MWRKSQKFFKEALLEPKPAIIIPLPDKTFDNISPIKEAAKVPNNILRNHPLYSLVSCWIVSLTPFNNTPEFSRDITIFIISFISSFEIIKVVVPEPSIFFFNTSINCRHSSS